MADFFLLSNTTRLSGRPVFSVTARRRGNTQDEARSFLHYPHVRAARHRATILLLLRRLLPPDEDEDRTHTAAAGTRVRCASTTAQFLDFSALRRARRVLAGFFADAEEENGTEPSVQRPSIASAGHLAVPGTFRDGARLQ